LFVPILIGLGGCGSSSPGGGSGGSGGPGGAAGTGGVGAADRWIIDNLSSIHGGAPMVIGTPQVMTSPQGDALCFDGDDAVVLDANPLQGLAAFTMEVFLRIDGVTTVALNQPRYLHIETADASRATMEARVNDTTWYLDTFLLSGAQSLTLVDAAKVHAVGQWVWTALTYDGSGGQMRHYVNGVEDASGTLAIPPFGPGKMSLGVRQNLVNWFKGCIREVRVTTSALPAAELQRP
jgi:hypothetical protein